MHPKCQFDERLVRTIRSKSRLFEELLPSLEPVDERNILIKEFKIVLI